MFIIKKINFVFLKLTTVYVILILFIILTVFFSGGSVSAAKNALSLCFSAVIPSLFPFFVFSSTLISCGFADFIENFASPLMLPLFNVSGGGALCFITGILSGYPAGAKICRDLYEKKFISRTEAMRLLPFCNNSGPLFIIGTVGTAMLKNAEIGLFLYIIHVISAVLVGFCFRFYDKSNKPAAKCAVQKKSLNINFSAAFSEAVEQSVSVILTICGFVVVFSCILALLCPAIDFFVKKSIPNLLIKGAFEITFGISGVASSSLPLNLKLILISALLGFGGLCVHVQVASVISKTQLGMKTYILGKILHSALSAVICFFAFKLCVLPVFAGVEKASVLPHFSPYYILSAVTFCAFLINKAYLNK